MEMRKLKEHFILFLLLIVEWNCPTLARSPAKLELNLLNTDGSTQQVSDALQQFLAGGVDLSPSQSVVINITPPSGSKDNFMQVVMEAAKSVVPKFVPNAGISFKLGASKSSDGYLSNVKLTVVIGAAVGGVSTDSNGGGTSTIPSANKRTVNLDLSTQGQNPTQTITQQIKMIMDEFKTQVDNNEAVQIVLQITPPKGSTQQYSGNVMSVLRTVLQQVVPVSMESSVKASMSSYSDGTIANMVVTITITPGSGNGNPQETGENIQIDLSNPGVNIQDAISTVLTTVVQNPTVMGDGNKPIKINLQLIPPPSSTTDSVKSMIGIIKSVLITLIPNAELTIKTSMSQGPNGVVTNVMSSITITPNSQQTPNQVNFNLDLSPPSSDVIEQLTNILPNIQGQIKPIIDNGEPATLNLVITPPAGVTDSIIQELTDKIVPEIQTVLPNKMKVTANASKDPQGKISQIILIVVIQPDIEVFSIDLTNQETSLVGEINNIIPNIKDKLDQDQPKNKPVSFSLNIQPPKGSTDEIIQDTMQTVLTTLSQQFPNNKIGVQAKTTKDSSGNIVNIRLIPTIEPNPNAEDPDDQVTLNVDLTQPGNNLIQEVTNILPSIEEKVDVMQPENKPVKFNLNIDPPTGTTQSFIKPTINDVLTVLSRIFPNNQIDAKAKTSKDPQGRISDVGMTFTIQPNPNAKNPDDVYSINLEEPGSDLLEQITKILPNLEDKVKTEQPKGEPITFDLNIQPPKGANDEFPKDTLKLVTSELSKKFPTNKIEVQAKISKDPQGNVSNVKLALTIQPDPDAGSPIEIDMSRPGSNIVDEVTKVAPDLKDKLSKEGPENEPVSFNFNIKPPEGSNEGFVKDVLNDVVKTVSKILPHNKVTVRAKTKKDPQGTISNVSLLVTVSPKQNKPKPETITFDMTTPGTTVDQIVTNILPKIQEKVPKEPEDEPVSFDLQVKPPEGTKDKDITTMKNDLIQGLVTKFPKNRVGIQTKVTKDPTGTVKNVDFVVKIHPKDPESVKVNLKQPGSNLVQNIVDLVPVLKHKIDKKHPEGKPVNFEVNVEPPTGSQEPFVKDTVDTMLTTLTKLFPNHKVGVQPQVTRDPQGNISNIKLDLNIQPSLEEPEGHVLVDLTKPGKTIESEITKLLPTIETNVLQKEPENEPVTFNLKVKPTKNIPDDDVKKITNTILRKISEHFPDNRVDVKTNTCKELDGTVTTLDNIVTIEPNNPTGTTRKPKDQKVVNIDISKPGTNLVSEISNILPNIKDDLDEKQPQGEPVDYNFKITPPEGTTDQTVEDLTTQVMTTISKLFPQNKVGVKPLVTKDPQGKIKTVDMSLTIEPTTSTENPFVEQVVTGDETTQNPWGVIIPTLPTKTTTSGLVTSEEIYDKTPSDQTEDTYDTTTSGQSIWTSKPGTTPSTSEDTYGTTPSGQSIVTNRPGTTPSTSEDTYETTPAGQSIWTNRPGTTPSTSEDTYGTTPSVQSIWTSKPGTTPSTSEDTYGTTPSAQSIWTSKPGTTPLTSEDTSGTTLSDLIGWTNSPNEETTVPVIGTSPSGSEETYGETTPTSEMTDWTSRPGTTTTSEGSTSEDTYGTTPSTIDEEYTVKPQKVVEIDLSKPGNKVEDYVTSVVPSILPEVEKKLDESEPVNLEFKVKPPKGVTIEDFVKSTSQSMIPILEKNFPNNKLKITTKAKKDPQGNVIDVVFVVTVEPNEEQQPEKTSIDFDLQKPGTTLEEIVDQRLPDVVTNVKNNFNKGKPTTIEFNIRPPQGAKEDYLQTTTQSLVPILKKEFPTNTIRIKTTAKKNPQGNLTNMTIQITVEPTEEEKPERLDVNLDLSKPGTSLRDEVDGNLPKDKVKPIIDNNLNQGRPVTLHFKVKPPKGSTQDYLQEITQELVPIMNKNFPNNPLNVKTTAQKNPQGELTDIILDFTINPSEPTEQQKPERLNVNLDLSIPGTSLKNEVDGKLPKDKVQPIIENNLDQGRPVNLHFKVKPPKGSTQDYLQEITQELVPIMSKNFPSNPFNVKTSAQKNPQGELTEIVVDFTIQPSDSQKPHRKDVTLDMSKPGQNINDVVDNTLPSIQPDVNDNLDKGHPVIINFKVSPPKGSSDSYIEEVRQPLIEKLQKYFPSNQINIETNTKKDPSGYIIEIIFEVTLKPSSKQKPKEKTVDIDLSKPGSTLTKEVDKRLPQVVPAIKEDLDNARPVTINFNIKPPKKSNQKYLQQVTNSLVPILSKYFPNNQIQLKTSANKDSQGYLIDMTLEITILPSSSQPGNVAVDVDLSKPGNTLKKEVDKVLPPVVNNVKDTLTTGKPVTLTFNVRPPKRSNQSYLTKLANQLTPILAKHFPSNAMSIKTSAQKGSLGYISDITLIITIQPSSTGALPDEKTVVLDLTSGVTITRQLEKVLPTISNDLKLVLSNGSPATLTFSIKPPKRSRQSYLQTITNQITPLITKYFPEYSISIKTSAQKTLLGFLSDIVLIITIQPSTHVVSNKKTIDLNLMLPGSSVKNLVNDAVSGLVTTVQSVVNAGQTYTLSFNIRPPLASTQSYLTTLTNQMVPILSGLFPNYKLDVKTSAQKGLLGVLTNIVITFTISGSAGGGEVSVPSSGVNVDLDLSVRGSSVVSQVNQILPSVLNNLMSYLNSQQTASLNFKIKPPKNARSSFVKNTVNSIVPLIAKMLPNYKIHIKADANQNSKGFVSEAIIVITIYPL